MRSGEQRRAERQRAAERAARPGSGALWFVGLTQPNGEAATTKEQAVLVVRGLVDGAPEPIVESDGPESEAIGFWMVALPAGLESRLQARGFLGVRGRYGRLDCELP